MCLLRRFRPLSAQSCPAGRAVAAPPWGAAGPPHPSCPHQAAAGARCAGRQTTFAGLPSHPMVGVGEGGRGRQDETQAGRFTYVQLSKHSMQAPTPAADAPAAPAHPAHALALAIAAAHCRRCPPGLLVSLLTQALRGAEWGEEEANREACATLQGSSCHWAAPQPSSLAST